MYYLDEEQVNLIRREVEKQDIHLRHLAHDLVDHICCEIEAMINQGKKFQEAFHEIMENIGTDGLHQLQKDTLFLTDKKYKYMKNSMKIAGVAGMILLAFGALFKIEHWAGAYILFITGFILLGALYFPLSMLVMRKEYQQLDRPLIYLVATTGGLAIIFAIMLKVLHWPGASQLFLVGYSVLGLLFLPLLLFRFLKTTSDPVFKRIYIIGAVSLFFCLAGGLSKFNSLPGATILLIVGSIGLTSVFFPLYVFKTFKVSQKIEPQFIFLCIGILYFNLFNLLLVYNYNKF